MGTPQITALPQLYLGTSGFSFEDWQGTIYPERLPKSQWLSYYEQSLGFNSLEVNYTYYQMPAHRTMTGLLRKTSEAFRFTVKTHRSMTHDVLQPDGTIRDHPEAFSEFRAGLQPMIESGRLGCVLAQFPYTFVNTAATQDYLANTMDRLADLQLVVEFRHHSWVTPTTFQLLHEHRVGWCTVDEPALPRLMPWVPEVTSAFGYVRFHGRNAEQWFGTTTAERYNYRYSDAELRELAEQVVQLPRPTGALFLFFNNCHAGHAAHDAQRFKALLPADLWASPAVAATHSS